MRLHGRILSVLIFVVLLAACAPTLPSAPSAAGQTPAAAQPTQVAGAPDEPGVTQSLAPITIAAPAMQLGSLYRYFDGTLLDAVPNDGPFTMGSNSPDNPVHQTTVNDFWVYSTEVTNQMYAWCVSLGKCTPPSAKANPGYGDPKFLNHPVVGVDWQQASDYCGFAHGRLPTEAEWEKVASWDAKLQQKRLYPWGDRRPACDLANYKNCLLRSAPVTDYAQGRSFYGAVNMEGNVYEWVSDWYSESYYTAAPATNPLGPDAGKKRVVRSSAFGSDGYMVDTAWRSSRRPGEQRADLGFRCVVDDPAYFAPYCSVRVFFPVDTSKSPSTAQDCTSPTIEQAGYCGPNRKPVANVKVLNTSPTVVEITGMDKCNPNSDTANEVHQCPLGTKIEVQASCPVNPSGAATCPVNYSPDPNNPGACVTPGGIGACPDGFQYDDSLRCCSAIPGNTAAAALCAAGQRPYNGVCVDDATGPREPASLTLVTTSGLTCTP